jgi:uncharacterized membrane protein
MPKSPSEVFLATFTIVVTLTIPLALYGEWIASAWALQAAVIIWVGARHNRQLTRLFGILVMLSATYILFHTSFYAITPITPINSFLLARLLITVAMLFSAYQLYKVNRQLKRWEQILGYVLMSIGILWWIGTGFYQSAQYLSGDYQSNSNLIFITLSCATSHFISQRLSWKPLDYFSFALIPSMYFALLIDAVSVALDLSMSNGMLASHPSAFLGYIAWPIAFITQYWLLHQYDQWKGFRELKTYGHVITLWLLGIVITWDFAWLTNKLLNGLGVWSAITWTVIPALFILGTSKATKHLAWPFKRYRYGYLSLGLMPIVIFLITWMIIINLVSSGNPWPLPYMPFINPLDSSQLLALFAIFTWMLHAKSTRPPCLEEESVKTLHLTLSLTTFVWLSAALVRTLHYWFDVPFTTKALISSLLVQSSLSIFWACIAFGTMFIAARQLKRKVWLLGATLLGIVLVKLFVVDLTHTHAMTKVVSFLAAVILLVILKYLTPLPPKNKALHDH